MDFSLSEEQTLLRNSLARYLADQYKYEDWRKFTAGAEGRDPRHWRAFAELGLLAAALPEEYGGLGGGPVESLIVMEEFGKALVVEPYVPTVVIGGGLIARAGSTVLKKELLPAIAAGETIIACAFAEPEGGYDLADLSTAATKQGSDYVLNGRKCVVVAAPWADRLIVTARIAGGRRDEKGVGVFLMDRNVKGVSARDYPTFDNRRASEITFENVLVPAERLVGPPEEGLALIEGALDEAIVANASEAVGCMKKLLDATVEYSKTRKQFGVPIGKFQALQHRMVDMFIAHEQSVSIVLMATLKLGAAQRSRAASAAKAETGKAGRLIGEEAVQIHGGIGMTDELDVGHYFKRLTAIESLYGSTAHHLARFSAQARDQDAALS